MVLSAQLRRRVFPVVHYLEHELALAEAQLAFASGADGVFLISHEGDDAGVMRAGIALLNARPAGKLVGVNPLSTAPLPSLDMALQARVDMLWGDAPGIHSTGELPVAAELGRRLAALPKPLSYFGSIAFKGQVHDPDPVASALRAQELGMLPTTSGPGTGRAPDVSKLSAIAEGLAASGEATPRLAVASGMDCDNIKLFLPYVTDILVATGVARDEHHFDAGKLQRFIGIVAGYNQKIQ